MVVRYSDPRPSDSVTMKLLLLLFSILSCLMRVEAQSIASFYSDKGPTIISLDVDRGQFGYTTFASKGFNSTNYIDPKFPPLNGSSLASIGYSSPTSIYVCRNFRIWCCTNGIQGSIFYQTVNETLVQLFFKCSYSSGNCVKYGEYLISLNVTVPVKLGTGLSASLLSTDLGYRLTYEDTEGSIRQLSYANNTKGEVTYWADGAFLANSTTTNTSALATAYIPATNTTSASQTIYQISNDEIVPYVNKPEIGSNVTQMWSTRE